jgi:hypothetical protein
MRIPCDQVYNSHHGVMTVLFNILTVFLLQLDDVVIALMETRFKMLEILQRHLFIL